MKDTALGEGLVTNIALSFACAIFATQLSPRAVYFIQTGGSASSNTYRRFIKDCASISKLLYQLIEHNRPFKWTDQCQESFIWIRRALVSAPVLAFPDCSRMFILDTDASSQEIGAVLSKEYDDGLEHVVAYASQALSKAERRYSVTCKELLAVVSFLHHFRSYYILGG